MADQAPKVITTRQAKKQIGFFGNSLALYILLFMALSYGTELLQNFNPSIFMGMDPQAFSLAVSMILMLFITMVPFRRSAQKLNLNIHDYLKDPNLRGDRIFALVCIGIGIDLIMTSVSTLFYFLFPTNMAEYSFLGNFSTRDAIIENILYFMMFVIVKPICDEYIFRGVIQRQLGHYGRYFGVLGSAVLYAIAQVNIAQAFPAFFVGWYLSLITLRYHSIRPGITVHLVIALVLWAVQVVPSKFIMIVTIFIVLVYILAGLFLFQRRVDTNMVRYGATEAKLWKILFTTPSIVVCVILFAANVVFSIL